MGALCFTDCAAIRRRSTARKESSRSQSSRRDLCCTSTPPSAPFSWCTQHLEPAAEPWCSSAPRPEDLHPHVDISNWTTVCCEAVQGGILIAWLQWDNVWWSGTVFFPIFLLPVNIQHGFICTRKYFAGIDPRVALLIQINIKCFPAIINISSLQKKNFVKM